METIVVEQLSKAYQETQAVDCISLAVERGEVLGVLGANGAGKSTLLECILGVRRPDSGKVSILGMNPVRDRKALFQRVGVQFQESRYQEKITVGELCAVTRSLYRSPADSEGLLSRFGLAGKQKCQVSGLSGGEKQRLSIVLALLPNPEVLFLDELTTGLDPRGRREVWKCISGLKQEGLTILLVSHFMDEVEALCDRICILNKGRTIFAGTVGEAIAASPFTHFEDAYLWYTDEEERQYESV
ncbi:ABC transporter ATP-binding protein ['Paenibacillus yunnanensis' Narsing Rao et al. 2020]|uniref:ABC transporter ATP-binding protein n=1 Tax=Paenibacillus tengchongensis TaxID=2608684 RepID=UPI00124DBA0C|nr:ABC transporter ATP-binding protein [Paenibacillus tengchongensis]